jgi:hypothetical protein
VTNSARHSGGSRATIRLASRDGGLEIQVDDDGSACPAGSAAPVSGNGILGMTERATALGGTLAARPRPTGGFRVRAWLPVAAGRAPTPPPAPAPAAPPSPQAAHQPAQKATRKSAPEPAPEPAQESAQESAQPGGSR